MQRFKGDHGEISYDALPASRPDTRLVFVWGHGWQQSAAALRPLAESLKSFGAHYLIDFPGFGGSPEPDSAWGSEEYAKATLDFIAFVKTRHPEAKIIWGCHSFGGRVGLQMASRAKSVSQKP